MNITPILALQNLYNASCAAKLSKTEHDACLESAKVLEAIIKASEVKVEKQSEVAHDKTYPFETITVK